MAHDKEAVLREWHSFRNSGLSPEDVTYGSNRTIWWLCEQGHAWQQRINDRIQNGHGCPVCAGRVKPERLERYAALMAERTTGPGAYP